MLCYATMQLSPKPSVYDSAARKPGWAPVSMQQRTSSSIAHSSPRFDATCDRDDLIVEDVVPPHGRDEVRAMMMGCQKQSGQRMKGANQTRWVRAYALCPPNRVGWPTSAAQHPPFGCFSAGAQRACTCAVHRCVGLFVCSLSAHTRERKSRRGDDLL